MIGKSGRGDALMKISSKYLETMAETKKNISQWTSLSGKIREVE